MFIKSIRKHEISGEYFEQLKKNAEIVVQETADICWYIAQTPEGIWATWDNADANSDIRFFDIKEEAIQYHRNGFEAAGLPEECWALEV